VTVVPEPLDAVRTGDHEIEVAILGPVEVHGADRGFARSAALELVVYLALHPFGASNDVWATALWPDRVMAPATLHSTASAARRALGASASGADHLPRMHGRLRLGRGVTTDWRRFEVLAAANDPLRLIEALTLVRGRPFEGLRCAEWTVLEGVVAAIEERVAEVAGLAADAALAAGDPRAAAMAARRGLLVSPYDERLFRRLLTCADAQGHPAGIERVMAELVGLLSGGLDPVQPAAFDLAVVHPETASLYERLSRRRRLGSGPSAATN
jgi:DNA-binding SARP family transcriptional activator